MRKVSLIPVALVACGLFVIAAKSQETGKIAKATASSTTPTTDQSLEWKSSFNPKISPDGKRVVYEVQKANWEENAFDRNLWIVDIATGESHALTSAKKSSSNPAWSPDGKWIAFISDRPRQIKDTPEGKKQLYVISADGGEAQQITKTENDVNAFDWAPDSRRIAFSMSDPEPKTLKDRKEKYGEYSVVHSDYQMAHLWIIDLPDDSANAAPEAKRLTEGDAFSVGSFAWSPDGTRIAFSAQKDSDLISSFSEDIYVLKIADKSVKKIVDTPGPDSNPKWSPDGKKIAFETAAGAKFFYYTNVKIAVVPAEGGTPQILTDAFDEDPGLVGRGADGTTIEGVVYKPANFDPGKKYPLLVVIHGGPTGVDQPIVNADRYYPTERFVAKGALVLRPNYRGSAGYGEKFRALNVRNLGVGDYADVISGVDALIAKGFVDKDRVGAMGWSEGGYISAYITTFSERFKAVSVGAGISDWMTYYVNTDITPFTRQYLHATPWDDPEVYWKTSPISHIAKAQTPTLIQHGENDKRVPIPNAYELRQALEDRGVPVKMVVYKGFGHGITKPKQQRAVMEENEKWFRQYIWGEKPEEPKTPVPQADEKKSAAAVNP